MLPSAMNNRWFGTDLGLLLGCLLLIAAHRCEAQGNLAPNPGFEEADSCTYGLGFIGAYSWYAANNTPDHLVGCQPYGTANGLPLNVFTYQEPYDGNSCVGLFTYHQNGPNDEQREWIAAPLLEPLVPGQTYYCSFRANAAFGGNAQYPQIWLASDKVGMLFTTYEGRWEWNDPFRPNHAHILYPEVLADTVGWTLVSGSFVADSAYRYVMIGQFFSNELTDTLHYADPNSVFPWAPRGYTLIDAVCVSPSPMGCDIGQNVPEYGSADGLLFPNPVRDELLITGSIGAHATIMDTMGRVIWQGEVLSDRWTIVVSGWTQGVYVLRREMRNAVESRKFVVE